MMSPIPQHISSIVRPEEKLLRYYFFRALATTVAFPVTMVYFYFHYHTMRYQFDEQGIRMTWGIFFHYEVMLNYARIQDVHLRSNAIERWLGLARIEIQTASGSSDAQMTLEGMTDHDAVRDFLYSRMRGAHEQQPSHEASPLAATLTEVANELRLIRETLERQRHA